MDKRRQAFVELHQWLLDSRAWVFPTDSRAPCTVHGGKCYANGIMRIPEEQRSGPARPSVWNIAGVTCHAWSAEGKGEGLAHPSALYHGVWHAERGIRAERLEEDGFFFECTSLFPVMRLIRDRLVSTLFLLGDRRSDLARLSKQTSTGFYCLPAISRLWCGLARRHRKRFPWTSTSASRGHWRCLAPRCSATPSSPDGSRTRRLPSTEVATSLSRSCKVCLSTT